MTHTLTPKTLDDVIRVARDLRPGVAGVDPEAALISLVCRALEREYPDHGALLDAIRAEAKETPHTQAWFKCRDAVTTEAMELADAIRAAKEQTND